MNMNFINIKDIIIKDIHGFFDLDHNNINYKEFKYDIDIIDLFSLINFLNSSPSCYFKSKDSDKEFLALGTWDNIYSNNKYHKIASKMPKNCLYVGAHRFDNENNSSSKEWSNLKDCFYFSPIVLIERVNGQYQLTVRVFPELLNNKNEIKEFIFHLQKILTFEQFDSASNNFTPSQIIDVPEIDDWTKKVKKTKETFSSKCLTQLGLLLSFGTSRADF